MELTPDGRFAVDNYNNYYRVVGEYYDPQYGGWRIMVEPVKRNPDEDLRDLERAVARGDVTATGKLAFARVRSGIPLQSASEFAALLKEYGPYYGLDVDLYLTNVYSQPWFLDLMGEMFLAEAQKLAEDQRWIAHYPDYGAPVIHGSSAVSQIDVSIDSDSYYTLEVKLSYEAPSEDEATEREGILEHHFNDWNDERGRDYGLSTEEDEWHISQDFEPNEGAFGERIQELLDEGLDIDEIQEEGPDIPQSVEAELSQRLGIHHIFAALEHAGIDVSDLIVPSIDCPLCSGAPNFCPDCQADNSDRITGQLYPNSYRQGYAIGNDWAYMPD